MERLIISEDDMVQESIEFANVYPILMSEIDHIEAVRGKLNDFQLMLAVSRAKDAVGILGWERRLTVNAALEKYASIYRDFGREEADDWVAGTFGFMLNWSQMTEQGMPEEQPPSQNADGDEPSIDENDEPAGPSLEEISELIAQKESELLQLYREYYRLANQES
ncbi:hypothetical protein D3P09_03590 [Paenibacillus pinisoli]|uniref:Uncharacterized protein n=1 Tax=Paenibacillus pinisoli TaxID=1276110 RepID=A0A3A6PS54_9BACL|nr:hypothetical protein [Paenibacillus pinisoli]RJX41099.1 hypothetical protein D3P09_03590 [Paenibacillus pinisoli]